MMHSAPAHTYAATVNALIAEAKRPTAWTSVAPVIFSPVKLQPLAWRFPRSRLASRRTLRGGPPLSASRTDGLVALDPSPRMVFLGHVNRPGTPPVGRHASLTGGLGQTLRRRVTPQGSGSGSRPHSVQENGHHLDTLTLREGDDPLDANEFAIPLELGHDFDQADEG